MEVERAPINRLNVEQLRNTQANTALADLGTKLAALQTAATSLKSATLFTGRTAVLSGTGWSASAGAGTPAGTYSFNVTQLATAARREGGADIGAGLSATNDVSGLTIATLPIGTAVTAGAFTINGARIEVGLADSLQDVFDAIDTATGGTVTASYDSATDKVTLSSTGEISLGAANDTSNFLRALKLGNNGTDTVSSSGALGTTRTTGALANAGLRTSITAVDGDGNGAFTINGVEIAYNVNTDSLSGIVSRINQAGAGVSASYDSVNDRVVFTNSSTGDIGLSVSEAAGGLLGALGLTGGGTLVRGLNTEFSVDSGPTLVTQGTTLDATSHGIAGLTVSATSTGAQSATVSANTTAMKDKIKEFITAYNALQSLIDEKSKITSANGKVTTSVLTNNREVQAWASNLRALAFQSVGGTLSRLESLGIDFKSGTSQLEIKDETKLDAALRDRPGEVEAFFQASGTGFASRFDARLEALTKQNGDQQKRLTAANAGIDRQIADLERRLEQQRALLTDSFIRMEEAQAKIQQQGSTITNAFFSNTGNK
jgi:flagellar hook-associated protein 2